MVLHRYGASPRKLLTFTIERLAGNAEFGNGDNRRRVLLGSHVQDNDALASTPQAQLSSDGGTTWVDFEAAGSLGASAEANFPAAGRLAPGTLVFTGNRRMRINGLSALDDWDVTYSTEVES